MVSVIVTTYKRKLDVLKRALDGVINQTYKDIEIVIVNDNPEEDENDLYIKKFVEDYNDEFHIKYIHFIENQGACKARNIGAKKANGEYLAFLDDDDEWIMNKIEKQVEAIQNSSGCVLVTGYVMLDNNCIYNQGMEYCGNVVEELLKKNFIGGSSVPLLRKKVFDDVGGFDERYPSSQDYNLWLKFAQVGEIIFLKEILIYYHLSEDSITNNLRKRLEGWQMILEDFNESYKNYPKSYHNFVYIMCEQLRNTGLKYCMSCIKYLIRDAFVNGISREWFVSTLRILSLRKS